MYVKFNITYVVTTFISVILPLAPTNCNCRMAVRDNKLENSLDRRLPQIRNNSLDAVGAVNLEEFTAPFATDNCYIHITNFQSRDIKPLLRFPVAIRHLRIILSSNTPQRFRWTTGRINISREHSIHSQLSRLQRASKYLVKESHESGFESDRKLDEFCLKVNRALLLWNRRPWSCEVDLVITPPSFLLFPTKERVKKDNPAHTPLYKYPAFWYHRHPCSLDHGRDQKFDAKLLPSMANFHIIYVEDDDTIKNDPKLWIDNAILNENTKSRTELDIFLVFQNIENIMSVRYYSTFRHYPMIRKPKLYYSINIELSNWREQNIATLTDMIYDSKLEYIHWGLVDRTLEAYKIIRNFKQTVENCNAFMERLNFLRIPGMQPKIDSETFAFVSIFKSIMGNNSYMLDGGGFCENGNLQTDKNRYGVNKDLEIQMILETTIGGKLSTHYPLINEDESTVMRFISCSRPQMEPLAVKELYNVFDGKTWSAILVTILAMSLALNHSTEALSGSALYNCILMLNTLLEQGIDLNRFPRRKLMLSVFLMMGVIISNGYKSTNVYKMISPRKVMRYSTFHELIENGFRIYSRLGGNSVQERVAYKVPKILATGTGTEFELVEHYKKIMIWSELSMYLGNNKDGQNNSRELAQYHDRILKSALSHDVEARLVEALELNNGDYNVMEITKAVLRLEEMRLKEKLKVCNKVAIALPEHLCFDYAKEVLAENREVQVNIGKENLGKYFLGIYFTGPVPPIVQRRIWAITSSGIIHWWRQLFRPTKMFNKTNFVIRPPSLNGNIMVVILLFVAGACIFLLVFCFEMACISKLVLICS